MIKLYLYILQGVYKKVATVNSKGKVTAKKAGKATIIVTTKDGKKRAKCTLKIK